jgi:hypothetical protein
MAKQVVNGAVLKCSFGSAPSALVVTPKNKTPCGGVPAANILDHQPMANIMPFGMCKAPSNPAVAAATTAAAGVLTPQPCVPNTPAPWAAGSPTVPIANAPALNDTSKCLCAWAGVIEVTQPGQTETEIP